MPAAEAAFVSGLLDRLAGALTAADLEVATRPPRGTGVTRDRGSDRIRLDSSAFLLGDELPCDRCGYIVGPPYAGDADVDVWAEKDLRARTPGCGGRI